MTDDGSQATGGMTGITEDTPGHAGTPGEDVSHGELVSTAHDYHRFLRALGTLVSPEHLRLMTTDQVPPEHKTPESFFPGFWDTMGWGFGVGVVAR